MRYNYFFKMRYINSCDFQKKKKKNSCDFQMRYNYFVFSQYLIIIWCV